MMHHCMRFIPNLLSAFRLVLAVLFPYAPEYAWSWLIVGGGGSDALDGWLARRWQAQSRIGAILDPAADKLFILSALLTLALSEKFSLYLVPPLLARDLLVAGTAVYAASVGAWESFTRMEVRLLGKLATAGQFILLLTAVFCIENIIFSLWPAILFSVLAAADYGWLFILELRTRGAIKHE
ncbi:MAG: CDP-alcohol phosphatidyltransferase family protein [Candidatus Electrothrix sp. AR4]|nr:CDP-alcohol phosphatidyltransferase family protein [Candidatus Electrothrix sp. AR4]